VTRRRARSILLAPSLAFALAFALALAFVGSISFASFAAVAAGEGSQAPIDRDQIHPTPPPHPGGHTEPAHPGKEAAKDAEDEAPGAINWIDFRNKEQPPYAALLINFGLLVYLYYRLGKKPVAEALAQHRASVTKAIEEAQRLKQEAEARKKTYQAKLNNLDAELGETKLLLQEAGKGEKVRIVKEAEETAVRMQKEASFLLEQEAKQLQLDLQRETALAALEAARELLKKRVTQSDQERLAEEFLASLEQRGSVSSGASR
jgi:F-type H+-transporting ATPase subunit b